MSVEIFYSEGAGNTFFLSFTKETGFEELLALAQQKSVDPDGYILCQPRNEESLNFLFYNKDGSRVDFCGNALRATAWSYYKSFGQKEVELCTEAGDYKVKVLSDELVEAQMPYPETLDESPEYKGQKIPVVMAGVPHLVFEDAELSFESLESLKKKCLDLRKQKWKGLETYNLSFYKKTEGPTLCVTFERGVEDFTLACGSGAMSVASCLGLNQEAKQLQMPGGLLEVFTRDQKAYMVGPAQINQIFKR